MTGVDTVDGVVNVAIANSDHRSFDEFQHDWSLVQVGDAPIRGFLADVLGLRPYTMIRWIPESEAPDGICP